MFSTYGFGWRESMRYAAIRDAPRTTGTMDQTTALQTEVQRCQQTALDGSLFCGGEPQAGVRREMAAITPQFSPNTAAASASDPRLERQGLSLGSVAVLSWSFASSLIFLGAKQVALGRLLPLLRWSAVELSSLAGASIVANCVRLSCYLGVSGRCPCPVL